MHARECEQAGAEEEGREEQRGTAGGGEVERAPQADAGDAGRVDEDVAEVGLAQRAGFAQQDGG